MDAIVVCDGREWYLVWDELDRVGDAITVRFGGVHCKASIRVHCRSNVPAFTGVWGPSSPVCWFFVDEHLASWGCEGVFVEVVRAPDLRIRGEFRV